MAAGSTPDDQEKLANTFLMLVEDLVTELHADKILSFQRCTPNEGAIDVGLAH